MTMNMLERLARALCIADGKQPDASEPYSTEGQPFAGPEPGRNWKRYVGAASAILRELQNPSEAMNEAGAKAAYDRVVDLDASDAGVIFSAMVDAALVDGA